ncbi:hypothetical protein T03_2810 [Trichinella britovi]|uniref:Uncharacterized protein n=1 Tax=Trichinella britovi TaxID=45882 RepID=A0A0V1CQ70_TRIBR|nr:hypothetical protein T03_2810 [Trichinella britovi]
MCVTGGVRTHADICPLDLKSNALTTRPPCCLLPFNEISFVIGCNVFWRWSTMVNTGGVRTHADICPLDLKSNALTTRPPCLLLLSFHSLI